MTGDISVNLITPPALGTKAESEKIIVFHRHFLENSFRNYLIPGIFLVHF